MTADILIRKVSHGDNLYIWFLAKLNFLSHQDNSRITSSFFNRNLKGEDDFMMLMSCLGKHGHTNRSTAVKQL